MSRCSAFQKEEYFQSENEIRSIKSRHMTAVSLPTQKDWVPAPLEDSPLYISVSRTSTTNWSPLYQFMLVSANLS